jgi:mono/diheme cytochrome c family protein
MMKFKWIIFSFLTIIFIVSAGFTILQQTKPQNQDPGVGPVKNVVTGPIDNTMVADGKKIYLAKCVVCHDLNTKKIGPPLKNITKERMPEYIMNLLVNAVQMQKQDPFVKELLKKYNNVLMPDPAISQAQARTVLEYLRSVAK